MDQDEVDDTRPFLTSRPRPGRSWTRAGGVPGRVARGYGQRDGVDGKCGAPSRSREFRDLNCIGEDTLRGVVAGAVLEREECSFCGRCPAAEFDVFMEAFMAAGSSARFSSPYRPDRTQHGPARRSQATWFRCGVYLTNGVSGWLVSRFRPGTGASAPGLLAGGAGPGGVAALGGVVDRDDVEQIAGDLLGAAFDGQDDRAGAGFLGWRSGCAIARAARQLRRRNGAAGMTVNRPAICRPRTPANSIHRHLRHTDLLDSGWRAAARRAADRGERDRRAAYRGRCRARAAAAVRGSRKGGG